MKLDISRTDFLAALAPCAAVAESRSPHPFGAAVLIAVASGTATLFSSHGYVNVRTRAQCTTVSAGTCAVPARELLARVQACADAPIGVTLTASKFTLKQGSRTYTLRTLPTDGAPVFPASHGKPQVIDMATLRAALTASQYVADDKPCAQFGGVVLSARDGKLSASASDRRRFARAVTDSDAHVETFMPDGVAKVLLACDGKQVALVIGERMVHATVGDVEVAYTVPDTGNVASVYDACFACIPANDGTPVSRKALAAALRAVTPDGVAGSVPVTLRARGGVLRLVALTNDGDEAVDEIEAQGEVNARVEAGWVIEAVSRTDGETLTLRSTPSMLFVSGVTTTAIIGVLSGKEAA